MSGYVNLKDLSEFSKYITGVGAGAMIYFDKFEHGNTIVRTLGILSSAIVVMLGVAIMSAKGRIKGDEIDYVTERDATRLSLFKIISKALYAQLAFLLALVCCAGWLSLVRVFS